MLRKTQVVLLIVALFGVTVAAWATVANNNVFELGPGAATDEGGLTNILGDGNAANGPDWTDLFDAAGTFSGAFDGIGGAFLKDDVSAGSLTDNTVYSGGPGDKNSDVIGDWTWTTSSVPAKDDVSNAYAYGKIVSGHLIIYAGVEREVASGDSHIDLEFFQNAIGLSNTPPCPPKTQCTFTGSNKDGDLLVNMDFSQGGTFAGLSIRKRHEGSTNNYDLIESLGAQGCNIAGSVCAFANGGPIDGGPWDNFDNHANIITTLPENAFTEFGVDVTALFGSVPCFSTIEVKTRSSQSFTATLKDFALHTFESCSATAATQIHSGATVGATHTAADIQGTSVAVGSTVHDKAIVTGTVGFADPTGTVTFKRYMNATCAEPFAAQETVTLTVVTPHTASTAGVAAAESASFTTTAAGGMCFRATYNGDSNYVTPVTSAIEPLTVNKTNSAVNTDIRQNSVSGSSVLNTKINNGTTIVDLATITGSAAIGDPTGTVTFQRFSNANCSGTAVATQTITITADGNPADGIATALSSSYTTSAAAGEFVSFKVIYSGDANYNPSTAATCEPVCSFANSPAIP